MPRPLTLPLRFRTRGAERDLDRVKARARKTAGATGNLSVGGAFGRGFGGAGALASVGGAAAGRFAAGGALGAAGGPAGIAAGVAGAAAVSILEQIANLLQTLVQVFAPNLIELLQRLGAPQSAAGRISAAVEPAARLGIAVDDQKLEAAFTRALQQERRVVAARVRVQQLAAGATVATGIESVGQVGGAASRDLLSHEASRRKVSMFFGLPR